MSYEVGDIIWVVGTRSVGLKVYQIVEQVTRKTLLGTVTSYMVKQPSQNQKSSEIFSLDNIKGEVFKSSSEVREYMTKSAASAIDNMIAASLESISNLEIKEKAPKPTLDESKPEVLSSDEHSTIILEDGTKARVSINPNLLDNL